METLLGGLGEKKKKCLGLLSSPDKGAVDASKKSKYHSISEHVFTEVKKYS